MDFTLFQIVLDALIIVPLWRVFSRAGLNPAFSLFILVPFPLGILIAAAILAFSDWPAVSPGRVGR
jgi:hypothetical protein